ncbi:hypothetical protein GQ44DRAFT_707979 [Phaeosphaeriaceae sp. PMI808]|nr:hypothetical protein GQ44DRAFT_707979 [Phaeosphaeriaceae sp. PMI808]
MAHHNHTIHAQSLLLRLPRELRDLIIRFTLDELDQIRLDFDRTHNVREHNITPPLYSLPPICAVSQQLYHEATPYFMSKVSPISFNLATTCWLRSWLATFPAGTGYHCIRHISFRNFNSSEQLHGYELIALCPNLRHLNIMFNVEYVSPSATPLTITPEVSAIESLDDLIHTYQLKKIFDVPKLQIFEFGFHHWKLPVSSERTTRVTEWFQAGFRGRGKHVDIVCSQLTERNITYDDVDDIHIRWYLLDNF